MSRTKYDDFAAEDFASDDHFITWCLHQNEEVDAYWNDWIKDHPQQQGDVAEARKIVGLLHRAEKTNVHSAMKKDIWHHLNDEITRENHKDERPPVRFITARRIMSLAASFLLLFGIYQLYTAAPEEIEWTTHANHSDRIEQITLSDGTEVALRPNSVLEYNSDFGERQREITLQGAAFFDVARDTSKPFLVYANQTITRVLGTSFLVKAMKGDETVEVEVETGAVAVLANVSRANSEEEKQLVFKKGDIEILKPNHKVNLAPNEKISFDLIQKSMVKSIVEIPKLLEHGSTRHKLDFDNDPVTEVFKAIESAYGINLDYDDVKLNKCTISTSLDDSPLFMKLDIICAALELSYEQKDAIIFISGNGC